MRHFNLYALFTILLISFSVFGQSDEVKNYPDFKQVHTAILDYVEALYLVDSTRIEKSVHTELRKRGYWFNKEKKVYVDNLDMTFEQLRNLSAKWNKTGKAANDQSPKEIVIFDITDKTASAKLVAEWGMDYFHLAKLDGKWVIMNVLWQSLPDQEK